MQGPFDRERLRSLARRGSFGRLHEVSEDGANWVRASTYPELFAPSETQNESTVAAATEDASVQVAEEVELFREQARPASWFYLVGSQQFGPLDQRELLRLIESGQLSSQTLVWTKGMGTWVAATEAGELGLPAPAHSISTTRLATATSGAVTDVAYTALVGTRPWVLFFAILIFIYATLTAISGLTSLFVGTKTSNELLAGQGIGVLLQSGIVAWVGFVLLRYSTRIQALKYSRSMDDLEDSLKAQHEFWRLVGVITVVVLAIVFMVGVWLFAAA